MTTWDKWPLVLVNANDIEAWPYVPESSPLWSLEYARDTQKILIAIRDADEYREIEHFDYIMGWLFDIAIAYYGLVTFTKIIPEPLAHQYLAILTCDMAFRPSPLLNSPENIDEHAKTAYVTLHKRLRPLPERFPCLLRAMKWGACLSNGEAVTALAAYIRGETWSGEAVNHFGGAKRVIEQAFMRRQPIEQEDAKFCWSHGVDVLDPDLHFGLLHGLQPKEITDVDYAPVE